MSTSGSHPRISGFEPVIGIRPRILILGSMPGVASLRAREYYAQSRNAFWPIMGELFGAHFALPYRQRLEVLKNSRIALWDVLESCVRPGSLDSAIDVRSVVANDFRRVFADHPTIRRVFFNGKKAAGMYRRYVSAVPEGASRDIALNTLPSTSPAHAAMSFAAKLAAWSVVRAALTEDA